MAKKSCAKCEGTQIVKTDDGLKPCPALDVTVMGRLACKLPDGTFDAKKQGAETANAKMQKDKAYRERNEVVAGLAKAIVAMGGRAGKKKNPIEGWNPEWFNCVYIELPTNATTKNIGGPEVEAVRYRKVQPLKGTEMGRFLVSECDKDLLDLDWFKSENTNGVYWKRQPHLPEPNGFLHRVVARRIWGEIPANFEVDHINRNPSDCSRHNLRLATSRGNKLNQTRVTHPDTGVYQCESGKWKASIGFGGYLHLGTFETKEDAKLAYLQAHEEHVLEAHRRGDYIYPPLTVSWHFHDKDSDIFSNLPEYKPDWDGHDNIEKYDRLHKWISEWKS